MMEYPKAPQIPRDGRLTVRFLWTPVPFGIDIALRVRKLREMEDHEVAFALADALLVACMNYDLDPEIVFNDAVSLRDDMTTEFIEEDDDADT